MSEFNISGFIKIMTGVVENHYTQQEVGVLLLSQIASREDVKVNVTPKMISDLVNQKADVHREIVIATAKKEVRDNMPFFFKNFVLCIMNPYQKDDKINEIADLLENDKAIERSSRKSEILEYYKNGQVEKFMAEAFLYALNRPNAIATPVTEVDSDIIFLLDETNNICPICNKKLIRKGRAGRSLAEYEIVPLYPEIIEQDDEDYKNVDEQFKKRTTLDGRIPLCKSCANEYKEFPTPQMVIDLCEKKRAMINNRVSKDIVGNYDIEDDIAEVIDKLEELTRDAELIPLKEEALKISKKIPNNMLLQNSVATQVVRYYSFVEALLSIKDKDHSSAFNKLASKVRLVFQQLDDMGNSHEEIVNYMHHWIMNNTGVGESHAAASYIVLCFFIQNCEVFNEIAQ